MYECNNLYDKVRDAVVSITVVNRETQRISTGSGIIISRTGYIVTAAHVIADSDIGPEGIKGDVFALVSNFNRTGKNFNLECDIIGLDVAGDIAVVRIKKRYKMRCQKYLKWGDSLSSRPGTVCFALGDPFTADNQSIAGGIIRDNTYMSDTGFSPVELVLTDISVFSGNSGGAVINQDGRILGIISFIKAPQGSGFAAAISQNIAEPVVDWIIKNKKDYYLKRGQLGLRFAKPLNSGIATLGGLSGKDFNFRGVIVTEILPNAPVLFGTDPLQVGDIITKVCKFTVGQMDEQTAHTTAYWTRKEPGDKVKIKFIRSGSLEERKSIVTLGPVQIFEDVIGNS